MIKLLTMGATGLLGIALVAAQPPDDERGGPPPPPPPPPKAKKAAPRPGDDLHHAYQLLRRLHASGRSTGRPEARLQDWTERASQLYRDGVKAQRDGDRRLAHEYGAAAHDLARAVEHSRNASAYEEPGPDLPPPPESGPEGDAEPIRADLWRAHDRIRDQLERDRKPSDDFYVNAARDLYNAARRDADAGRLERAGELGKAADAITHVLEHLSHASGDGPPEPPPLPPHPPAPPAPPLQPSRDPEEGPAAKRPPHEDERPKAKRGPREREDASYDGAGPRAHEEIPKKKKGRRDGDPTKAERRRTELPPPL